VEVWGWAGGSEAAGMTRTRRNTGPTVPRVGRGPGRTGAGARGAENEILGAGRAALQNKRGATWKCDGYSVCLVGLVPEYHDSVLPVIQLSQTRSEFGR
jgi:hypothetical protein